jgi:hypothetical protein
MLIARRYGNLLRVKAAAVGTASPKKTRSDHATALVVERLMFARQSSRVTLNDARPSQPRGSAGGGEKVSSLRRAVRGLVDDLREWSQDLGAESRARADRARHRLIEAQEHLDRLRQPEIEHLHPRVAEPLTADDVTAASQRADLANRAAAKRWETSARMHAAGADIHELAAEAGVGDVAAHRAAVAELRRQAASDMRHAYVYQPDIVTSDDGDESPGPYMFASVSNSANPVASSR